MSPYGSTSLLHLNTSLPTKPTLAILLVKTVLITLSAMTRWPQWTDTVEQSCSLMIHCCTTWTYLCITTQENNLPPSFFCILVLRLSALPVPFWHDKELFAPSSTNLFLFFSFLTAKLLLKTLEHKLWLRLKIQTKFWMAEKQLRTTKKNATVAKTSDTTTPKHPLSRSQN
jgi:hypothetical protein